MKRKKTLVELPEASSAPVVPSFGIASLIFAAAGGVLLSMLPLGAIFRALLRLVLLALKPTVLVALIYAGWRAFNRQSAALPPEPLLDSPPGPPED